MQPTTDNELINFVTGLIQVFMTFAFEFLRQALAAFLF